jgi:type II secretory pathway component PulJ
MMYVKQSSRAFTLLETMLAAVLGAMVIVVALSLFSVVQRSDKRSQIKMEENLELAHAHTALARTFHMLLMSSDPRPNESETNDFLKKDDERNAADQADQEDEDATSTRVSIQPDINNPVTMMVGAEGEERRVRSQIVHLTVRDSPVLGEGDKTEEQQLMDEIMRERVLARAADRLNKRVSGKSGSSSRSENSNAAMSESMTVVEEATGGKSGSGRSKSVSGAKSSTGKNMSLRDRNKSSSGGKAGSSASEASGLSTDGDRDERTASERLDDQEEERPRAPGVRGVFEILPDGVDAGGGGGGGGGVDLRSVRLEEMGAQGVQTYSLWWRELPPIEINNDNGLSVDEKAAADADGKDAEKDKDKSKDKDKERKSSSSRSGQSAGDQIDREVQRLADASDSSGKRVRLLSGLQTCHWTAFRGRKERDKITAKYDSHLPAFVELEVVTASGRRENWIFDVAWTIGPEPGSVLAEAPDALNNGLASTGNLNGTDGTDNGTNNGTGGTDGKGNGNTDGTGNGNGNTKGIGKGGKGGKPGNDKGDGKSEQQRAIEEIQKAIRRATGGDKGGGGGK